MRTHKGTPDSDDSDKILNEDVNNQQQTLH